MCGKTWVCIPNLLNKYWPNPVSRQTAARLSMRLCAKKWQGQAQALKDETHCWPQWDSCWQKSEWLPIAVNSLKIPIMPIIITQFLSVVGRPVRYHHHLEQTGRIRMDSLVVPMCPTLGLYNPKSRRRPGDRCWHYPRDYCATAVVDHWGGAGWRDPTTCNRQEEPWKKAPAFPRLLFIMILCVNVTGKPQWVWHYNAQCLAIVSPP